MIPDNQLFAKMFNSLGFRFLADCVAKETNKEILHGYAEIIQEKAKQKKCESILGELYFRGYLV